MAIVTGAIDRMLQQHEPHQALVLDRHWNVVRTNEAAPRFFGSFVDLETRPKPRNLLDLMFDPAGMRPFVEDWERVAAGLLQRVRREAVGQVVDAGLQELLERLRKYPGIEGLHAFCVSSIQFSIGLLRAFVADFVRRSLLLTMPHLKALAYSIRQAWLTACAG